VAALEYAADAKAVVAGKPSPDCYLQALDLLALPPERVVVVSDDPFSDLAGAKRLGLWAAFVLVGKYPDAAVVDRLRPEERPDVVVAELGELRSWAPLQR
jgi:ribonucleotide monophosphatase NagD (HAD superfamily)